MVFLCHSKRVNLCSVLPASTEQGNIQQAMNDISSKTCVTFEQRTSQTHWLNIIKGEGCYSYVGRLNPGSQPQELSLGEGCAEYVS